MGEKKSSYSVKYKIFDILGTIITWIVAVGIIVAALIFAQDQSPTKSIFGYRYYTVLTASMEPELSVGDFIIVKLTDAEDIEVGDVITFNPSSDSEAYLTHRVTEKIEDYDGTGVTCFRTKGDNNDTEDTFLLDESRIIGTVQFNVPVLGYAIRFIQLRWYYVVPLIILIFIFIRLMKIYFGTNEEESGEPETEPPVSEESGEKFGTVSEAGRSPPVEQP